VKPLGHKDQSHLQAAEGLINQNSLREAEAELAQISQKGQGHPRVFRAQSALFATEALGERRPGFARAFLGAQQTFFAWIVVANNLEKQGRNAEAREVLLNAVAKFPPDMGVSYHLARCCAKLGDLDCTSSWLEKAFALAKDKAGKQFLIHYVQTEPALEPFREKYGNGQ
jgi:tetratricopeptide (TPR) repeat protein